MYAKASVQRSEGDFAKSILLSAYLVVFIHLAILSAHLLKLENSPKSIVSVEGGEGVQPCWRKCVPGI